MADKRQDYENKRKNKKLNAGPEPLKKSGREDAIAYAFRQYKKEKAANSPSAPAPEGLELEKNAEIEKAAILSKQVLDLLKMKPK